MKWFKHDSDANMDAKLKRLRIKYGMAGYGLYWYCLELIAQGIDQKKITFELEHDAEILAHDTGINYQVVNEMMIFMVDIGLFENVNGAITCFKMAMRLDDHTARNPQIKDIQAKLFKHTTDKLQSDSVVTTDTLSSRVEESRVEENRVDNKLITKPKLKRFVEPTLEDVRQYFFEQNETQSTEPQRFHDYYSSNGWKVGKNKMKCWKSSARGWISRNKSGGSNATYKQTNQPTIDPNDTSWGDEFITTGSEQGNAQPSERDIQGFEGDSLGMEAGSFIGFDRGRH